MSRMAVDVVLLPERDMAERALTLNHSLVRSHNSEIVLDPVNCLPHVSLAMGCILPDAIPAIASELTSIAQTLPVRRVYVQGLKAQVHHGRATVSSIELRPREDLQQLHVLVMEKMAPYFSCEVTEAMFTGERPIAPSSLDWVRTFIRQSSGENFCPHITLGYGQCESVTLPPSFAPQSLALCHLGNHCTCRKILCSVIF